ncbi:protein FAM210B, mitochondrial [Salminus brasiliensis]|uniref:protein FAM210B, mitochondrial n=1 Tax=Salminus brasiliensis TaxID=930266 RepID=UPI003B835B33
MFLCRTANSVGWKYRCNFAGTAEVGINLRQYITWALRDELDRVRYTRDHDKCFKKSYTLCWHSETLENDFVKRTEFEFTSGKLTQAQSVSVFTSKLVSTTVSEFTTFRFPRMRTSRKTSDDVSLNVPGYFFMDKVPSGASSSSQKQATWTKDEPTIEVKKVQPTKISQGGGEDSGPEKKQTKTKQLKMMFKEYGAVGVSFHIGTSLISLGIAYLALSSGINMAAVLCKMGFSESVVQSKLAAGTSTFLLAYAVHKLFAPLRISVTLVSVPLIVRYLRRTGLFKPPPSNL